jgi:hypothetical protein
MSKWIRKRIFFYIAKLRELPKAYPDDNVRIYPEFPLDSKDTQTFWRRVIALFRITDDNRTMGVHIGILFFFVPVADCLFYGLQWCFWWLQW